MVGVSVLVRRESEFIHRLGRLTSQWGLGEPVGRIWGVLLFENKPLTQDEIKEKTGYSVSLISTNLTLLHNLGFVVTIGKRGRKKLYRVTASLVDAFQRFLKNFVEIELTPTIELLSRDLDEFKDRKIKVSIGNLVQEYRKIRLLMLYFLRIVKECKKLSISEIEKIYK